MRRIVVLALTAATFVACGKSSSSNPATADDAKNAGISTPSKMAQQAHSSSQYEADTSETAATGSSDGSGTASKSAVTASSHGSVNSNSHSGSDDGVLQFSGGMNYNQIINGNFNTAFNYHGYKGPNTTDDGSVSCDVHFNGANNLNMTLTYDVNQTLSDGDMVNIFTDPSIAVSRSGSRDLGKIIRILEGTVRRQRTAADANAQVSASDANFKFDFTIDHNNTQITDTYVTGDLNTRTHQGELIITDNIDHSSAVIEFNQVVRGKPKECMCPSAGTISVMYTDFNGNMSSHSYTFGSMCGQVMVTSSASATASANANTAVGSASATTGASVVTTETWPNCTLD